MAANKQALKRSAQITNNSSISTPSKPIKPKMSKRNDTEDKCHEEIDPTNGEIHRILQQIVMKLDIIDDRAKSVEQEMKIMKDIGRRMRGSSSGRGELIM